MGAVHRQLRTARGGKPRTASRGAGVARAKRELGNLIDRRLKACQIEPDEPLALMVLRHFAGLASVTSVRRKLRRATLGDIARWSALIQAAELQAVVGALGPSARKGAA